MAGVDSIRKVYRLRKLPNHICSHSQAAQLLGDTLNTTADQIIIHSLAKTSDRWEGLPSKVATLQLKSLPTCLQQSANGNEWELALSGVNHDTLILDTHFKGLTVLNDVEPDKHRFDCIAISGLASHPFGSWQPHGPNKSYMWIRDELPKSVPGVRFILYGYDSTLAGSNSFQSISDIGLGLIHQLQSGGWDLSSSKPIIFLAHSLGGLILKEALVQLADRDDSVSSILMNMRGAIMFGVPSLGMQQSHLMAIVKGQPNEPLIQDLSRENGSTYLRKLNKSFEGISFTRTTQIFWAYETKESKTVVRLPDGSWDKNGPLDVLVNPDSATSHRNHDNNSKGCTIPINEDHSNMVKFARGNPTLGTIISVLLDLSGQQYGSPSSFLPVASGSPQEPQSNHPIIDHESPTTFEEPRNPQDELALEELDYIFASLEELHSEIYSTELNFRLDQIEDPFEDTFKWVYDLPLFCEWLQHGSGLFWIHGKPASGKSTLMKFILRNRHTGELLYDFNRRSYKLVVGFFFHYRGTALQKSFEGVLRSLIIQILAPHYKIFKELHETTWQSYKRLREERMMLYRKIVEIQRKIERRISDQLGKEDPENASTGDDEDEMAVKILKSELEVVKKKFLPLRQHFQPYLETAETQFLKALVADFHDNSNGLIAKLEKLLRRLLEQDTVSMDVTLFFDALDEFDGHLDMIVGFIKGLTKVSCTPTMRLKVCLSSRPWATFHTHFSTCPNLSLQDHTKQDIEKYATSSLTAACIDNSLIVALVPEIRIRANGVFLWVKLAVQELSTAISTNSSALSIEQLRRTLKKLPDDLQDFYEMIIERINTPNRHQTYRLLELLVRQQDPPASAEEIRRAVLVSSCSTYEEAQNEITKDNKIFKDFNLTQVKKRVRDDILTWSGGLVEIQDEFPQFMHQTVLEFVMGLSFKTTVLGHLAALFPENGYSFHLKYWLYVWASEGDTMSSRRADMIRKFIQFYVEQSEATTGNSQLLFISTTPDRGLRRLLRATHAYEIVDALLGFIVLNRLALCLGDWVAVNPGQLRFIASQDKVPCPLLSSLTYPIGVEKFDERHFKMAQCLLENGYKVKHDPGFFPELLRNIWRPEDDEIFTVPDQVIQRLMCLALEHGQDPNVRFGMAEASQEQFAFTALHLAPASTIALLVSKGAAVNARDSKGKTPLDWAVVTSHDLGLNWLFRWSWKERYQRCKTLVDAGGVSSDHTTAMKWTTALDGFDAQGFDTEYLRAKTRDYTRGSSMLKLLRFGLW